MKKLTAFVLVLILVLGVTGIISAQDNPPLTGKEAADALKALVAEKMFNGAAEQYNRRVDGSEKFKNIPKSERPYVDSFFIAEMFAGYYKKSLQGDKEAQLIMATAAETLDTFFPDTTLKYKIDFIGRSAETHLKSKPK